MQENNWLHQIIEEQALTLLDIVLQDCRSGCKSPPTAKDSSLCRAVRFW
jgi:hypothetical protein